MRLSQRFVAGSERPRVIPEDDEPSAELFAVHKDGCGAAHWEAEDTAHRIASAISRIRMRRRGLIGMNSFPMNTPSLKIGRRMTCAVECACGRAGDCVFLKAFSLPA